MYLLKYHKGVLLFHVTYCRDSIAFQWKQIHLWIVWPLLYLNNNLISFFNPEDYPEGTWLGDENNPEMRVRCPVSQADMLHISTNCRTPEKMALTLLDYLFHREVQAMSNLSGQGKHGKKQLDPLMIYGIRCEYSWTHTIHHLILMRPAVARLLGATTTTTTT